MKVYAHRGSSLIWPENTMVAFEKADAYGAEGIETDLRLSNDGEIILAHDDNLARFGHPDRTVSELTTAEVCDIKIPSLNRKIEDNIITLRMLLQRFPRKDYIFDCKITSEALMQKLKALLAEQDVKSLIWFLTWSAAADALVKTYFPQHEIFPREPITRRWGLLSVIGLGIGSEPPNRILSLPPYFSGMPVFKRAQIASIHARGKTFLGYLVNTVRDYNRCVHCGVRAVLTDRPDMLAELQSGHRAGPV